MPQDMTASAITESLKKYGAKQVLLVEMSFDAGVEHVWNGQGNLVWGALTFNGMGQLGQISQIISSIETRPFSITLTLSGIPETLDMVSLLESEEVVGRPIKIYLGYLDDSYKIIADPVLEFSGRMDTLSIVVGSTITVTLTAESRLADWNRSNIRRYTDADQQEEFPGDTIYEFTRDVVEKEIFWGGLPAGGSGVEGPVNPTTSVLVDDGSADGDDVAAWEVQGGEGGGHGGENDAGGHGHGPNDGSQTDGTGFGGGTNPSTV